MAKAPKQQRTMMDGLENLVTGMGTSSDKRTFTTFNFTAMNREQLESAYRSDWIARKVIDIPAYDATREWREWQAEKDVITKLETVENDFFLLQKVKRAMIKGRLYGGAALVMGVAQGQPQDELIVDSVKAGDLKFVHAVSRWELTAGPIEYDITSPYYGEPKYYQRTTQGTGATFKIHPSRVIRILGMEPPDLNSIGADGWADSILQIVQDAIISCSSVANGIANMVDEAKLDVISIPGLTANIQDDEYEARLKKRFGLASTTKSIYRMLLLDKEETWQRITQGFSGLEQIVQVYLMIAAGAADIPATRMIGQSPKGMNATGENDTRNYYDKIATEQKTVLGPALSRLDEVVIRSALGARPPELYYEWRSLWQLDETASATVALNKAQAFKIDVDSGVIDLQVLREARQNQLIEDGTYPGLEATIEEFAADMEDLSPEAQAAKAAEANATALAKAAAGGAAPPAGGAAPPAPKTPVQDMGNRIRKTRTKNIVTDAQPRTLYVYRPLLNWKDVAKWAKANGFDTTVGKDMHVTIAYSTLAVDWAKACDDWCNSDKNGELTVVPGGMRMIEKLQDATALLFTSSALSWRWCSIKESTGADWKWPDYQPHVTISYNAAGVDPLKLDAYNGQLVFGPEVWQQINGNFKEQLVEDAKWSSPR